MVALMLSLYQQTTMLTYCLRLAKAARSVTSSSQAASQLLDTYIKDSSKRSKWLTIESNNMCDSSSASFNHTSMLLHGLSSPQPNCTSILDTFKEIKPAAGKKATLKHWQAVAIIVDMPYRQRIFDDTYSGTIV